MHSGLQVGSLAMAGLERLCALRQGVADPYCTGRGHRLVNLCRNVVNAAVRVEHSRRESRAQKNE